MFDTIRSCLSRPDRSLLEDGLGLVALIVLLVAALHLPGAF